jgi:ADP-heptose:LPS heptosyltransferase
MTVLIKNAFAVLSNCTGVSHIASALNTPGVIISMDGEPERWGPQQKDILYTHDWLREPDFQKIKEVFQKIFQEEKPLNSWAEYAGPYFSKNN